MTHEITAHISQLLSNSAWAGADVSEILNGEKNGKKKVVEVAAMGHC